MKMSFDMRALAAAQKQFQEIQERKALLLTQKLTLDVGRRVIEGSPVDSGEFRGNWEIESPTASGQPGRVSNPTPYGAKLARGGSEQAPDGWIMDAVEGAARARGAE